MLKPSGKGCFIEPLSYNPVIEVYRHIAHTVRTADEHPLSFRDIEGFASHFQEVTHREFWLTTLAVFLRFYLWERVDPKQRTILEEDLHRRFPTGELLRSPSSPR